MPDLYVDDASPTASQSAGAEPAAEDPSGPRNDKSGARDFRWAITSALVYVAFFISTTRIHNEGIVVVSVTTLISLLISLAFTVLSAQACKSHKSAFLNLAVALVVAGPSIAVPILFAWSPHASVWQRLAPVLSVYFQTASRVPGARSLLVIWLAAATGTALSRVVREMKVLLPAAIALAFVDMYAVYGSAGVVHKAVSGASPAAAVAMRALTAPMATTSHATANAMPMQLTVGFADFMFVAFFFACFARFGVPSRRLFWGLFVVLALYSAAVFQFSLALPALVPIAVVVIGANLRRFRYDRAELFALLYAGLIVCAIAGILYLAVGRK